LVVASCITNAKQRSSSERKQAVQILDASGIKGGLIVHIGCGDGRLTAALRANDSYLVHGLDTDAQNVEKARKHIQSLNLYGKVSVDQLRGNRLPYTDNLVNLLVSEAGIEVARDEVMRVLAPNGVAYIKKGDTWTKTVKPRPKEIDEWTHFLHDATNNAVAKDSVVAPPHHIQWVGGPEWARSHDHLASVSVVVSSGGRIFYIVDEGPTASVALPSRWFLVARDAFNGVILWKRPVGPWEGQLRGFRSGPAELTRRLVAVNDRVYVTLGYGKPVAALDAATGKTVTTYEGTENTLEIVCDEGLLFLVAGDPTAQAPSKRVQTLEDWLCYPQYVARGVQRHLMVFDADTGRRLWKKADSDTAEIMPTTLAVGGGRVFFQSTKEVICLEAESSRELWRTARPVSVNRWAWSAPTLVVHGGVVLSADRNASAQVEQEPKSSEQLHWVVSSKGGDAPIGDLIAFSAKTGKKLWTCECRECYNAPVDVLVTGGLVWTGNLVRSRDPGFTAARDLLTGEVKKQRPPDNESFTVGMGHHRCYRNKATSRYLLLGRAGVEFIELESGKALPHHWVRGTCQYGIMPCNGLLYAPPHSCACYIRAKLSGFNALAPRRKAKRIKQAAPVDSRLERGPAYGHVVAVSPGAEQEDWPTYRHDAARSGSTKSTVPATLERKWQAQLGPAPIEPGRGPIADGLTSPVVTDGKVFVASVDTHTIHALDVNNGKTLWSYTAGGRVDSPPTIYKGLVLFGSADGWVYCLRASDGKLVWRFRAAPEERRVVAYGQLESVWPVHGSVLVQDDVAYFAAGRSSYLDGGIYLYRLDPKTGKLLSETCTNSRDPRTGEQPKGIIRGTDMPGALPDVLSSDGTFVYMRHIRFDRNGVEQEPSVPHLYSPAGFLDDSWWHRTYWLVGTRMGCGYGRWPTVGNIVPSGRLLVFDASNIYGFGRNQYGTHGSHIGLGRTHFRLFAASRKPLSVEKPAEKPTRKPAKKPAPKPAEKKKKQRRSRAPVKSTVNYHWSRQTPLVVQAMVLADSTLFLTGLPDLGTEGASILDTRRESSNALLYVVSVQDGKKLAEYDIESLPVFDGMAAANGRLYISTRDGQVLCMGNAKGHPFREKD
jgi:outer membrane protein assembly factor BamB